MDSGLDSRSCGGCSSPLVLLLPCSALLDDAALDSFEPPRNDENMVSGW